MELQTLMANARQTGSKCLARQARRAGAVPAILYGGGKEPISIQLDQRQFDHFLHSRSGEQAVVRLDVRDQPENSGPALLKQVQHHPIRGHVLHVDLIRVRLDQRITTMVPLELTGRAVGVATEGGLLDHQLREIEVECLAVEVPERITVDVTDLHLGSSIHVRDLVVPEGVVFVTDGDRAVAAVHALRTTHEAAAETAEAGAESEASE